jgi:rSAM/selenodomain-associated transferase 2
LTLSIIIPALNEAASIADTLARLQPLRARGHEVIVVDGGSGDGTAALAAPHADHVLRAPRARASQMNAGARHASGDVLLFLHADTRLPADSDRLIAHGLQRSGRGWGRFDVAIEGRHPMLAVVACGMNLRSRLTSVCTGDQGIFVKRTLFERIGGFPTIDLMEDIALSKALRERGRPLNLRDHVMTSGRRWEKHGVWRTVALMWWLRLRYFLGARPAALRRAYEGDER